MVAKVRADKEREAKAGHDGTWVAHPGLVQIAMDEFNKYMPTPNQIHVKREDVSVTAADLLEVPKGTITLGGLKNNIDVGIQYLEAWLRGNGCVPIHNLMEDAATAEISRAQLWQWIKHSVDVHTSNGIVKCSKNFYITTKEEILRKELVDLQKYSKASAILDELVLGEWKWDFLTIPAYRYL
jgi:malate synthase